MSALRTLEGLLNTLNFELRIEIVNSLQFALLIFLDRHQLLDYCWLVPWWFAHCLSLGFDIVDACMQMLFLFFSCLPLHSCMFSLSWIKNLVSRAGFLPFVLCLKLVLRDGLFHLF